MYYFISILGFENISFFPSDVSPILSQFEFREVLFSKFGKFILLCEGGSLACSIH